MAENPLAVTLPSDLHFRYKFFPVLEMLKLPLFPLSLVIWLADVLDPSYIVKESQQDSVWKLRNILIAINVTRITHYNFDIIHFNCLTINSSNSISIVDPGIGADMSQVLEPEFEYLLG